MKIFKVKSAVCAMAMSLLSVPAFSQGPIPVTSGLIGSWDFTGGSLNDGTGTNNGTAIGTAAAQVTDRCGNANAAIQLSGSNYIELTSSGPTGTTARSVSFWMKTTAASVSSPKAMFSYGVYTSGAHASYEINWDYGCKGVGPDDGDKQYTYSSNTVNDGCWHHIVATEVASAQTNQIIIYFDGAALSTTCNATGSSPAVLNTIGARIRFGATTGASPGRKFVGALDGIYLYNRALTAAEVGQLYAQCSLAACTSGTVSTGGCCLGNKCYDAANPLLSDYEISMSGFNFDFTGDANQLDKVNVGYPCGSFGNGKLNSTTSQLTSSSPGYESISALGSNNYSGGGKTGIGVMGEANNRENGISIGVLGNANGGGNNIGGKFYAARSKQPSVTNIGVSAFAMPSTGNPAPYAYSGPYPNASIGVYGAGDLTNSASGTPGGNWAAWFDGDVYVNGAGYIPGGLWNPSDKRYKKDIAKIDNVAEKLKKLSGYTYTYRTDEFSQIGFSKEQQIGVIAQELKEVFPQLVHTDVNGYFSVNYEGLIPVLLEGFKAQQQQIDELKALVSEQTSNNTANNKTGNATAIAVTLSDNNAVVLNQNVPNPFAESTVISYVIPADFTKAQITFSNAEGVVIRVIDIREKGPGSLSVFANDLTHGSYTYTLVIDGKVIDSKKMIKE